MEFVKDPKTKEAFDKKDQIGLKIGAKALEKGLLTRPRYEWLELTPPLTINKQEIDQIVDILVERAKETIAELH